MMLHEPVMVEEVAQFVKGDGVLVDATAGTGGHTLFLLSRYPDLRAVCVDRDPESLEVARSRLAEFGERVKFIVGDYRYLPEMEIPWENVTSLLFDLGMSSFQLSSPRGFSYQREEELDMRFNREEGRAAWEFLRTAPFSQLVLMFRDYGDLRRGEALAREVLRTRPRTTSQMVEVVRRVYGKAGPELLSRVFQAIRIGVNRELEGLEDFVYGLARKIPRGSRMIFLTYHSGEDRLVKNALKRAFKDGILKNLTPRVLKPTPEEIKKNPRARSAKMRVAERC